MEKLKDLLTAISGQYRIHDDNLKKHVVTLLVSNNWYGASPLIENGEIYIEDKDVPILRSKLTKYCASYHTGNHKKWESICERLHKDMPKTASLLKRYIQVSRLDDTVAYRFADFLLYALSGELPEATDQEVQTLMEEGYDELPKFFGDLLADYINWTKMHTKTVYQGVYSMEEYFSHENSTGAYEEQIYLKILYYLYNPDYIEQNKMYKKAAVSKNYVDTWLFLSMHFLCALRNTDLIRIPHPRIGDEPGNILRQIRAGTFQPEKARSVLYSIVWRLDALMLTPNKTSGTSGVSTIKFHVPESVEEHIGTLFAAAEAHFQISGAANDKPLIRVISSYEQINRYMGKDIGDLFLENNFHSRQANKSYLQMIYLLTNNVLGENDEFKVKGYILAALARSHKGSYGSFAQTTSIYLKDAKMNGYSPELVAREMFERGVLSSTASMLLKMISDGEYEKLSVEEQTHMIQSLNMSPAEIERSVGVMQLNMKRSRAVAESIYQHRTKEEIMKALHRIGNGEAVSKCDGCMCLMTAIGALCPHNDIQNCVSCEYEIGTKTTLFIMLTEYKRLLDIYHTAVSQMEKTRSESIARDVVVPAIGELLKMVEEQYGREGIELLEKIIEEQGNG